MSIRSSAASIPIIGGLFDDSDQELIEELQRSAAGFDNIQVPNEPWEDYRPENFDYSGDLRPEDYDASLINEDPGLRSRQMAALDRLSGLADTGLSELDELAFNEAQQLGAQQARAGREAAVADANRRGVGGSGLEFAMREIANQGGAQRAQDAGLNRAATAAQQRAAYQMAYGNALSGLRGEDFRANQANTDILNRFNELNTTSGNRAQERNLDAYQTHLNNNTAQRNDAQQYNQQGRRDYRQQRFDNDLAKAQGRAGAGRDLARGYASQNAARTNERNANTALAYKAFGGA